MANLIGTAPNQVPTNGSLGTMAFQDADNAKVENITSSNIEYPNANTEVYTVSSMVKNDAVGIIDPVTGAGSLELVSRAYGVFTSTTIEWGTSDNDATVMVELLGTGYSGGYCDVVLGKYSTQPTATIRSNLSTGNTVSDITITGDNADTRYSVTINWNVTHPVLRVKIAVGGMEYNVTDPVITWA